MYGHFPCKRVSITGTPFSAHQNNMRILYVFQSQIFLTEMRQCILLPCCSVDSWLTFSKDINLYCCFQSSLTEGGNPISILLIVQVLEGIFICVIFHSNNISWNAIFDVNISKLLEIPHVRNGLANTSETDFQATETHLMSCCLVGCFKLPCGVLALICYPWSIYMLSLNGHLTETS